MKNICIAYELVQQNVLLEQRLDEEKLMTMLSHLCRIDCLFAKGHNGKRSSDLVCLNRVAWCENETIKVRFSQQQQLHVLKKKETNNQGRVAHKVYTLYSYQARASTSFSTSFVFMSSSYLYSSQNAVGDLLVNTHIDMNNAIPSLQSHGMVEKYLPLVTVNGSLPLFILFQEIYVQVKRIGVFSFASFHHQHKSQLKQILPKSLTAKSACAFPYVGYEINLRKPNSSN